MVAPWTEQEVGRMESTAGLRYVLILVSLWPSPFIYFLTSENWMCLLVNGIPWFIFIFFFSCIQNNDTLQSMSP